MEETNEGRIKSEYLYRTILEAAADADEKIKETGADACEITQTADGRGKLILYHQEQI